MTCGPKDAAFMLCNHRFGAGQAPPEAAVLTLAWSRPASSPLPLAFGGVPAAHARGVERH